jgi:hypothetical protein
MSKELIELVDNKIEYYQRTLELAEAVGRLEEGRRLRETVKHLNEIKQALNHLAEIESVICKYIYNGIEASNMVKNIADTEVYDYDENTRNVYSFCMKEIDYLDNYILKQEAFREKVKLLFEMKEPNFTVVDFNKLQNELKNELGVENE